MFFSSRKNNITRGQRFILEAKQYEETRREAMKIVVPHFIRDAKNKVTQDSKLDPRQRTFVYETKDILMDPLGYSKGYFDNACINGSNKTPYLDELNSFAQGFADAERDQDYEIRIEKEGKVLIVDFQNVEKLAAERIKCTVEEEKNSKNKT